MKLIYKIKALITGIIFLLWTLLACLLITPAGSLGFRKAADLILRYWGVGGLLLFGIRVVSKGLEKLRHDRGVLILFNHQSHVDILIMAATIPKSYRFGAKIELFSIPLFGRAMRAVGNLPIARNNRNEVFKVYREAQHRFSEGQSFALAPEGTRQPTPQIGGFKKGPFHFALGAKAPVQAFVIRGAFEVLSKKNILPNDTGFLKTVYVDVSDIIESSDYSEDNLSEFVSRVRDEFTKRYDSLPAPT